MEEIIKEYKERFGNIKKKFVRGSKEDFVGLINELSINILKAQNKELRKEKRTMRAVEETGSDVGFIGAGYTIGFNRALKDQIERNNKIINNLSK